MNKATTVHISQAPIVFNWKQTGTNCDEPVMELVPELGHDASIFKSHDTKLWTAIIDGAGKRKILGQAAAKKYVEDTLTHVLRQEYLKAVATLNMLSDVRLHDIS